MTATLHTDAKGRKIIAHWRLELPVNWPDKSVLAVAYFDSEGPEAFIGEGETPEAAIEALLQKDKDERE